MQSELISKVDSRAMVRAWLALLAACLFVAGCASMLPVKKFVRQSASYDSVAPPNVDQLGVFVDGTVEYNSMSGTYIDIADSRTAIGELSEQTNSTLTQKGYAVDFTVSPFVGGMLEAPTYRVAPNRDMNPTLKAPPFDAGTGADPAYDAALRSVSQGVLEAFAHPALLTDTRSWSAAARNGLGEIAAKKHIRYLLVVDAYGRIESNWKQAGQGAATALATALLTMGTVVISAHDTSYLDSYVILIDLESSDILWSNGGRLPNLNPGRQRDYEAIDWAWQFLYYLPPRANAVKATAGAE